MPKKLSAMAKSEGILVAFYNLPVDILGAYYRVENKPPVILLHKKIKPHPRLLRCIFAEELGHHFKTAFYFLSFARSQKCLPAKYEKLALFWAVEYLMPLNELIQTINSGIISTYEISEKFNVTTRFAGTGIRLYFEKKGDTMKRLLKKLPKEVNIGF